MSWFHKLAYKYDIWKKVWHGAPIVANLELSGYDLSGITTGLTLHSCVIDATSDHPKLIFKAVKGKK